MTTRTAKYYEVRLCGCKNNLGLFIGKYLCKLSGNLKNVLMKMYSVEVHHNQSTITKQKIRSGKAKTKSTVEVAHISSRNYREMQTVEIIQNFNSKIMQKLKACKVGHITKRFTIQPKPTSQWIPS